MGDAGISTGQDLGAWIVLVQEMRGIPDQEAQNEECPDEVVDNLDPGALHEIDLGTGNDLGQEAQGEACRGVEGVAGQ